MWAAAALALLIAADARAETSEALQADSSPDGGELDSTTAQRQFVQDRQTRSPNQALAPRPGNAPISPPPLAGFLSIPGTQMRVRFGGDVSTVFFVTSKLMGAQTQFVTSTIPVSGQPYFESPVQATATANQSDLNFEFRTPTPAGELRIVYNNDFSNPSSSAFSYTLNYFYAQVADFLVGVSNSIFVDVDSYPNTLDYAGPNALVFKRHALTSYSLSLLHDHHKHLFVQFGIEVPGSLVPASAGTPRSVAPDGTGAVRYEAPWGHLQLAALVRGIGTQSPSGEDPQTVFGWGLDLTVGINTSGGDYFSAGVAGGQGLAAYMNDTESLPLDAAPNASGRLVALPLFGVFGGYTHQWSKHWSSTGTYGYLTVDDAAEVASLGSSGFQRSQYASINLVYRPYRWLMLGVEGLWGYDRAINGASGQAWRGQANAQFTF